MKLAVSTQLHKILPLPTSCCLGAGCWGQRAGRTGGAWGWGTAEAEVQEKDRYVSDPALGCGSSVLTGWPLLSLFPRLQTRRTAPASPLVEGHTRVVYTQLSAQAQHRANAPHVIPNCRSTPKPNPGGRREHREVLDRESGGVFGSGPGSATDLLCDVGPQSLGFLISNVRPSTRSTHRAGMPEGCGYPLLGLFPTLVTSFFRWEAPLQGELGGGWG